MLVREERQLAVSFKEARDASFSESMREKRAETAEQRARRRQSMEAAREAKASAKRVALDRHGRLCRRADEERASFLAQTRAFKEQVVLVARAGVERRGMLEGKHRDAARRRRASAATLARAESKEKQRRVDGARAATVAGLADSFKHRADTTGALAAHTKHLKRDVWRVAWARQRWDISKALELKWHPTGTE